MISVMDARTARTLNILREVSDILIADQDHLLELMDDNSRTAEEILPSSWSGALSDICNITVD